MRQLVLGVSVVRNIVMPVAHANLAIGAVGPFVGDHQRGNPSRVGLECQRKNLAEQIHATGHVERSAFEIRQRVVAIKLRQRIEVESTLESAHAIEILVDARAIANALGQSRRDTINLERRLRSAGPAETLSRGYAIVTSTS